MDKDLDLTIITAKKLLEKFGAGSHKPGSGSAMAFQAMLGAELINTVIELTNDPLRRKRYIDDLPILMEYRLIIQNRILPNLEKLFYQDSVQFGKVIEARNQRDELKNNLTASKIKNYRYLKALAGKELEAATDIVLDIADCAVELAKQAKYVFNKGFQAARGDSGSSYSGCISSIDGCLSIAELNLLSFEEIDVIETFELRISKIRKEYDALYSESRKVLGSLKTAYRKKLTLKVRLKEIEESITSQKKIDSRFIENIARDLQNILWLNSDKSNPIKILNPIKTLNLLGYEVLNENGLDSFRDFDGLVETAGMIDNSKMLVRISDKFSIPTQKFTLAHELGHALFHKSKLVLHRDRGLDSGNQFEKRNDIEIQADKFAAYFLMPAKQVKEVFFDIFKSDYLKLDDDMAFALISKGVLALRSRFIDKRTFARFLASTTIFNGESSRSLVDYFGVSSEAMAIRLEELNLFEY